MALVGDDGLYLPKPVGAWGEEKYDHFRNYAHMFTTGMRKQWPMRVYVDLFSGAGRARIKETLREVDTSALIALGVQHPFDRYVFSDRSPRCMKALKVRVERRYPAADARFVRGDCNAQIESILRELPPATQRGVLGLCVVDPFGIADLRFETIRHLAAGRRMDFLVLIPSHMDAHRNKGRLLLRDQPLLDHFLGSTTWRARWDERSRSLPAPTFGLFVVEEFGRSMRALDYLDDGPKDTVLVDHENKRLYHLAFYSRSPRGADFWRKAKRSSTKERLLPGLEDDS